MSNTTYSSLPYPVASSTPNVPQDFSNLANALDQKVTVTVASASARTALSNKYDGMLVYEQSTKRFYRWDGAASAWVYAGGAPPPIVGVTLSGGWTQGSGLNAACYKNASGEVCMIGEVTNDNAYNPNAGPAQILTLPVGYRPAVFTLPFVITTGASGPVINISISSAGAVTVSGCATTSSIPQSFGHWFNGVRFHPGYAGSTLA